MLTLKSRSRLSACARRLIYLLAGLALAGGAHAQSSITLYGIIDSGIEYVNNVGASRSTVLRTPQITGTLPSRWGLRGKEDLGGGLSTVFVLESGFATGQGSLNQGGRLFGRQAYVGISSDTWGTLSFGRQYSQIYWGLIGDTLAPNLFAAGVLDGYLFNSRDDNAIVWSKTIQAFTVGVTYSLGRDQVASAAAGGCAQSADDWKACKAMSAMLKYDPGTWGIAAVFDRNIGGGGVGSPLPSSSQTDTRYVLDGYFKLRTLTVGGGLIHRVNEASLTPTSNYWFGGATYALLPQVVLDAQYGLLRVRGASAGASAVAVRAMYLLSKSSATYVTAGRVFNQAQAAFTIDGGNATTSSNPALGVNQTGVMVGIRHLF
ncbi:porin [Paraburkholderia sp. BCC1886]|uniref:porin n=1 Tax=Paraburkholderia sp. BCC1886 TaxID=2562670 RepID=UPI001181E24A|nr:porin [Paraburkholderia sp. BCC1886]